MVRDREETIVTVQELTGSARHAPRREQLAEFLRSRRARITPEDVGIPGGPRRRTPGLRREEVAQLAAVGVTWYTWLEQGRPINVSTSVLDAIARTLRLDGAERDHLFRLADLPAPPVCDAMETVSAEIRDVVDSMSGLAVCVVNSRFDILAWNDDYELLFPGLVRNPRLRRNMLYASFVVPDCCNPFVNRVEELPRLVATLRGEFGKHVGEPVWEEFIAELVAASPQFATMWATHDVARPVGHTKVFRHPAVGTLAMRATSFHPMEMPESRMTVYRPVGAEDRAALDRLRELRGRGRTLSCSRCADTYPTTVAPVSLVRVTPVEHG